MKRLNLLCFFLLLSLVVFSQEITVKKFGQAAQFIAAADKLKDYDGDPCAVIKIQGAKIDSVSGAIEVRKLGAEVWAYMTNGDRRLTIYKQGYEPKTVLFSEFGYEDVKSDKVYLMTIYAPELTKQKLFIGIHGGMNFSTASDLGPGHDADSKWVTGFNVGASGTYMFTDIIGTSLGLYFATKGYKYSSNEYDNEKGDFQFVDIPVQVVLNFSLSEAIGLQLMAGPCFSINVGGKKTCEKPYENHKFSDVYSSFQVGGQAGFKLIVAKHYAIGADYQMGFGNYKSYSFGVNVGYIF